MPRKHPLNQRESEICQRLHRARRERLFSRVQAAAAAKMDSSQLARYELRRVPLRFADAKRLSRVLRIGIGWLATGAGGMGVDFGTLEGQTPIPQEVQENGLLSEVFDSHLAENFAKMGQQSGFEDIRMGFSGLVFNLLSPQMKGSWVTGARERFRDLLSELLGRARAEVKRIRKLQSNGLSTENEDALVGGLSESIQNVESGLRMFDFNEGESGLDRTRNGK